MTGRRVGIDEEMRLQVAGRELKLILDGSLSRVCDLGYLTVRSDNGELSSRDRDRTSIGQKQVDREKRGCS